MTKGRTLLTCGEHAVLVEVAGLDEVLALAQAVREAVAAESAGIHRHRRHRPGCQDRAGRCCVTMPRWVLSGKPWRLCRTLSLANARAAARL